MSKNTARTQELAYRYGRNGGHEPNGGGRFQPVQVSPYTGKMLAFVIGDFTVGQTVKAILPLIVESSDLQWYRSGLLISGQTSDSYTLLDSDTDQVIECAMINPIYKNSVRAKPQFPLSGAAITIDLANDRYVGGTFDSLITFSRGSQKTDLTPDSPVGYAYKTFQVNERAWVPGRGDLIEADGTNLFANPTAPASQTVDLAVGIYVQWMNGTGSIAVAANTAVLSAGQTQIPGAGTASQGSSVKFKVLTAGTVDLIVSGDVKAAQLETIGATTLSGTSFMPTGSRKADRYILAGAAFTALQGANCSVVIEYETLFGTAPFGTALRIGSQALAIQGYTTGFFSNRDNGSAALTNSVGAGTTKKVKAVITWSAAGRSVIANGGLTNFDTNTLKAISFDSYMIGHIDSTTGSYLNGYAKRLDIFTSRLSDVNARKLVTNATPARVMMGDSLTARNDGPVPGKSVPQWIDTNTGAVTITLNGGVEGNTSTAVKNRYLNHPELFSLPLIILTGNNNIAATSTILADIASMVAANTSGKILILSPINGQSANYQSGGSLYVNLTDLTTSLASTYGTNYYDQRADLVAAYNAADPLDIINHTEDRVPGSLRLRSSIFNITAAIDASQTNFVLGANPGADAVLYFPAGGEYIRVTTSTSTSGGTITACTRAYGTGGAATTHAIGDVCYVIDNLHLNDTGRALVGLKLFNKIKALGWLS